MTVREYCEVHLPIAYFNIFVGEIIYIHDIEHGVNDYVYLSDSYGTTTKYHKLRIRYDHTDDPYVVLHNTRIHLNDCVKI